MARPMSRFGEDESASWCTIAAWPIKHRMGSAKRRIVECDWADACEIWLSWLYARIVWPMHMWLYKPKLWLSQHLFQVSCLSYILLLQSFTLLDSLPSQLLRQCLGLPQNQLVNLIGLRWVVLGLRVYLSSLNYSRLQRQQLLLRQWMTQLKWNES